MPALLEPAETLMYSLLPGFYWIIHTYVFRFFVLAHDGAITTLVALHDAVKGIAHIEFESNTLDWLPLDSGLTFAAWCQSSSERLIYTFTIDPEPGFCITCLNIFPIPTVDKPEVSRFPDWIDASFLILGRMMGSDLSLHFLWLC